MSEHQYYEFQAIDRRLDEADRQELRTFSSRATITATAFSNHYEWGDFKGDPDKFMDRWFDLHLYLANWGTRRLTIRVPHCMVDITALDALVGEDECVTIRRSGTNLILDITRDELEADDGSWGDEGGGDSDWLAALAPLRADVIAGDLRLFYLLWLMSVEYGEAVNEATEPLPGIGPLTSALKSFADFFCIDGDLVAAAAERISGPEPASDEAIRAILTTLSDDERLDHLARVARGDPQVAAELQSEIRRRLASQAAATSMQPALRTAQEIKNRAEEICKSREKAEAGAKERRAQLDALLRRGADVWREIESEIDRRNAAGYVKALDLLAGMKAHAKSSTDGSIRFANAMVTKGDSSNVSANCGFDGQYLARRRLLEDCA